MFNKKKKKNESNSDSNMIKNSSLDFKLPNLNQNLNTKITNKKKRIYNFRPLTIAVAIGLCYLIYFIFDVFLKEDQSGLIINNSIDVYYSLANPSIDIVNLVNYYFKKTEADIVGIAFYQNSFINPTLDSKYIQFMYQKNRPGVLPIPNARYYLAQNNLLLRYRFHQEGDCVKRSFEQSGTISFSCPLFYNDTLYGYVTIEYSTITLNISLTPKQLEFQTRQFAREASPLFYPIWSYLNNN